MARAFRSYSAAVMWLALLAAAPQPASKAAQTEMAAARPSCPPGVEDRASELCAQWKAADAAADAAYWAMLSVVVGALGVIGLLITIIFTRRSLRLAIEASKEADEALKISSRTADAADRQARIAEDTAQRQLRAYVVHDRIECGIGLDPAGVVHWIMFRSYIRNTGQTPALLNYGIIDIRMVPAGEEAPDHEVQLGVGPPLKVTIGRDSPNLIGMKMLSHEHLLDLHAGNARVFFYIAIGYADTFGTARETRYVIEVRPIADLEAALNQPAEHWKTAKVENMFSFDTVHGRGSYT